METRRHERPLKRGLRWIQAASVAVALAAVILLAASLETGSRTEPVSSFAQLVLILVALAMSIALQAHFLLAARNEHSETMKALDATEREFKSIFDSALEGILILDDGSVCREANPATLALWGVARDEIVGQRAEQWLATAGVEQGETGVSERPCRLNEAKILRPNGTAVVVEYTVKANYLPGRHVAILRDITDRKRAQSALRNSEERFRQMATNIQEIFWMLDARDKKIVYVNPAYETITGQSCAFLREDAKSFQILIHPEDRKRVLARWSEALRDGRFDEEFRIVRTDHAVVWLSVRGFPVRDRKGVLHHIVGTAQDISARKSAEEQMLRNFDLAESARDEAEALRNTSLALTQNLSMDDVLDTLLHSLLKLIPCESARVLLWEAETLFFTAREMHIPEMKHQLTHALTFNATDNRFLMQILTTKTALLLSDTDREPDWRSFLGHSHFHSWLCVPLIASQRLLGLLSLGHTQAQAFSQEHLRLAKSLAIPGAVAIQNARLYERSEIYAAELEQRLDDLQRTRLALQQAEQAAHFRRPNSERS